MRRPPACHQTIIWTNADLLSIGPFGSKPRWNFIKNIYIFIQENAFENVLCKMVSNLSCSQSVDIYPPFPPLDFFKDLVDVYEIPRAKAS